MPVTNRLHGCLWMGGGGGGGGNNDISIIYSHVLQKILLCIDRNFQSFIDNQIPQHQLSNELVSRI